MVVEEVVMEEEESVFGIGRKFSMLKACMWWASLPEVSGWEGPKHPRSSITYPKAG